MWICPATSTGESWPINNAADTSGIVIHSASPNAGNYLLYDGSVITLSSAGARGSWVIRAVQDAGSGSGGARPGGSSGGGSGGGAGSGADGGGDGGGDGGFDSGLMVDVASITPASAEVGVAVDIAIVGEGRARRGGQHRRADRRVGGGARAHHADRPRADGAPAGVHDV